MKKKCDPVKPPRCPVPFGGPASGLWPLGGNPGENVQPVQCNRAALFSDCFRGCDSPAACGYTVVVGSAVFTGQNLLLDPDSGAAVVFKTIATPSPFGTTLQIRFQEIGGPVQPTTAYGLGIINSAGMGLIAVQPRGDGTIFVQINGVSVYNGTWTPLGNNAPHTISLSVDLDGTPHLFIDQVMIPLVLGGSLTPAPFGPAAAAAFLNFGGTPPPSPGVMWGMFWAQGNWPPTATFCCPDGQPIV